MSKFPMVRLATKSTSFSRSTRRTPVSHKAIYPNGLAHPYPTYSAILILISTDVVILTSMGEQAAIEAKEAPKNS